MNNFTLHSWLVKEASILLDKWFGSFWKLPGLTGLD